MLVAAKADGLFDVATHLMNQMLTQSTNQVDFLCETNELMRRNVSKLRGVPTRQGFHSGKVIVRWGKQRLVVHDDFAVFNRELEVMLHGHFIKQGFFVLLAIAGGLCCTLALGLVHGNVCPLDEIIGRCRIPRIHGNANTAAGDQLNLFAVQRFFDDVQHITGERQRLFAVCHIAKE